MRVDKLPVVTFLAFSCVLPITFSFAISLKHITRLVPYISDSGALPPESCIFGQMLNIIACLMASVIYVRYRELEEIFDWLNFAPRFKTVNKRCLLIGLMASFGVSLVANFQEATILIIHWIGALLAFGLGSLYQCIQTNMSYKIIDITWLNNIRLFLSIVSSASYTIFAICGLVAAQQFEGESVLDWKKQDGGYVLHQISAVSEWLCAICTVTFLLTFQQDFQKVEIEEPRITVQNNKCVEVEKETEMTPHI